MNEFEEQTVDYIDGNVPSMVEEQAYFAAEDQSYQADGTVGADDQGNFMEDGDGGTIITADGQEYDPEGREGAGLSNINQMKTDKGPGGTKLKPNADRNAAMREAGVSTAKGRSTMQAKEVAKAQGQANRENFVRGVKSGVSNSVSSAKGAVESLRLPGAKAAIGKAGAIGAGVAGAAALGAGAMALSKRKDEDKRAGGRFGEGEFEETYEAPYTGEVVAEPVNYADPVEANYASIQAAVNYAMQDNRL